MKLFFRWLFSWRMARRALMGVAVIVTLYALFCTEENIRGKRAWDKYRQELEARGEQLDFKAFIPKLVPDEQNFAATPLIKSWFHKGDIPASDRLWDDNYPRAESRVRVDKGRRLTDIAAWGMAFDDTNPRWRTEPGKLEGRHLADATAWGMAFDDTNPIQKIEPGKLDGRRLTDVAAWGAPDDDTNPIQKIEPGKLDLESRAKAAPAVLEALKTDEAAFVELRITSRRPYSRYPIDYNVGCPAATRLPHLNNVRAACRRLQLKACAELAAGQSKSALEDVKLILDLADSLREESFVISYLVRIACVQHAIQPIWEGLAEHAWLDAQLQELQTRLQPYGFVADLKRPLDGERAVGTAIIDYVRHAGRLAVFGEVANNGAATLQILDFIYRIGPSGWFGLEQHSYVRLFQLQLKGTFDATRRTVSPSRVQANHEELGRAFAGRRLFDTIFIHHRVFAALLLPAFQRISLKAATAQTVADQAALACALERYRLADGQFPEKLDALVPRFIAQLPHDVITGEPYKYRRTDDGRFVLYSVGWNEKDDGGVPGKTLFDEKEGDWVWQYPEPTIVR